MVERGTPDPRVMCIQPGHARARGIAQVALDLDKPEPPGIADDGAHVPVEIVHGQRNAARAQVGVAIRRAVQVVIHQRVAVVGHEKHRLTGGGEQINGAEQAGIVVAEIAVVRLAQERRAVEQRQAQRRRHAQGAPLPPQRIERQPERDIDQRHEDHQVARLGPRRVEAPRRQAEQVDHQRRADDQQGDQQAVGAPPPRIQRQPGDQPGHHEQRGREITVEVDRGTGRPQRRRQLEHECRRAFEVPAAAADVSCRVDRPRAEQQRDGDHRRDPCAAECARVRPPGEQPVQVQDGEEEAAQVVSQRDRRPGQDQQRPPAAGARRSRHAQRGVDRQDRPGRRHGVHPRFLRPADV